MKKSSGILLALLSAVALATGFIAYTNQGELTRPLGMAALVLLCFSLMIGPLAVIWPKRFGLLVEPRRAIGIATFLFVLVHLTLAYAFTFRWNVFGALRLPQIQLGAIAASILFVLAFLSNDFALKKLGKWWKRIQQFNYLAFVFAFGHFWYQSHLIRGFNRVGFLDLAVLGLGLMAVVLQIAGFFTRKNRMHAVRTHGHAASHVQDKEENKKK
jgi:DMSO/TMAO reductase YedYZ heme-binding membrane subunit